LVVKKSRAWTVAHQNVIKMPNGIDKTQDNKILFLLQETEDFQGSLLKITGKIRSCTGGKMQMCKGQGAMCKDTGNKQLI
jgi:hypothetical protein